MERRIIKGCEETLGFMGMCVILIVVIVSRIYTYLEMTNYTLAMVLVFICQLYLNNTGEELEWKRKGSWWREIRVQEGSVLGWEGHEPVWGSCGIRELLNLPRPQGRSPGERQPLRARMRGDNTLKAEGTSAKAVWEENVLGEARS